MLQRRKGYCTISGCICETCLKNFHPPLQLKTASPPHTGLSQPGILPTQKPGDETDLFARPEGQQMWTLHFTSPFITVEDPP